MTERLNKFHGCDEMRAWLISEEFNIQHYELTPSDKCNWIAYKPSALPARECEGNEGKKTLVVVHPYQGFLDESKSAEIDVTGESGGVWFKLSAYGLTDEVMRARLPEIEASLIAAWNALLPNKVSQ